MRGAGSGLKNMAMCRTNLDLRGVVQKAVLSMFVLVVTISENGQCSSNAMLQPQATGTTQERMLVWTHS